MERLHLAAELLLKMDADRCPKKTPLLFLKSLLDKALDQELLSTAEYDLVMTDDNVQESKFVSVLEFQFIIYLLLRH